ncbi:MAG TPA: lactonase family protein [Thermoanaerobaculia bacterium]|nr:lactonase family protein [Thermoanaerobaculia bacterium]
MALRTFLRKGIPAAVVLAVAVAATPSSPSSPSKSNPLLRVFVGTYTSGASRGIQVLDLDAATGAVVRGPVLAGVSENPSFLALRPDGRVLYAVNETETFRGAPTGSVSAFAVDPSAGTLTLLNQQPSGGLDPCHLAVAPRGRRVVVANYTSGSVAVLPADAEGRLGPAARVRRLSGSGPNASRQQTPHAHGVFFDPSGRFLLTADLGSDRLLAEVWDPEAGTPPGAAGDGASFVPGSGPRHLSFDPSGRILYVVTELFSTVTAFRWDGARGRLEPFQTVPAVAVGYSGDNKAAEIAVSRDGRFVYASNRGDDSLVVLAAAPTGALSFAGRVPSGGKTPRHFAIDPSGRWLVAANQDSGSVVVFRLDRETGLPGAVGSPIAVPDPVCILFAPGEGPSAP